MEKGETRQEFHVYMECQAPEDLFTKEWDELSCEAQQWYEDNPTLPCEGSGDMTLYCHECRFCTYDYEHFSV